VYLFFFSLSFNRFPLSPKVSVKQTVKWETTHLLLDKVDMFPARLLILPLKVRQST
jgi:hypothetical protein